MEEVILRFSELDLPGPRGPAGPQGGPGPAGPAGSTDAASLTTALITLFNDMVAGWGNSLMGSAAATYRAKVATSLGVTDYNGGVSGQGSTEIAIRHGGTDLLVTFPGNVIPASSAPVVLTSVVPYVPGNGGAAGTAMVTRPLICEFPVILPDARTGKIVHDAGGAADPNDPDSTAGPVTWTWVPTASAAAAVAFPANSRVHCINGDNYRNAMQIIAFLAVNNASADPTLAIALRDLDSIMRNIPNTNERVCLIGDHIRPIDVGSYKETIKRWWNEEVPRRYSPDKFIDINYILYTIGLALAGVTNPTANDIAAMNGKYCPPSLLADPTHFTAAGYDIVWQAVLQFAAIHHWLPGRYPTAPITVAGAAPTMSAATATTLTATVPAAIAGAVAYKVEYRKLGTTAYRPGPNILATASPLQAVITGLDSGFDYETVYSAVNIAGQGPRSAPKTQATTGAPPVMLYSENFNRAVTANLGTFTANNGVAGSGTQSVSHVPANTYLGINAAGRNYLANLTSCLTLGNSTFNDHGVEMVVSVLPTANSFTLYARQASSTGGAGYRAAIGANGNLIVSVNPGSGYVVVTGGNFNAGTVKAGDKVKLSVVGSTIEVRINDVILVTLTDTQVTAGTYCGWTPAPGVELDDYAVYNK